MKIATQCTFITPLHYSEENLNDIKEFIQVLSSSKITEHEVNDIKYIINDKTLKLLQWKILINSFNDRILGVLLEFNIGENFSSDESSCLDLVIGHIGRARLHMQIFKGFNEFNSMKIEYTINK